MGVGWTLIPHLLFSELDIDWVGLDWIGLCTVLCIVAGTVRRFQTIVNSLMCFVTVLDNMVKVRMLPKLLVLENWPGITAMHQTDTTPSTPQNTKKLSTPAQA